MTSYVLTPGYNSGSSGSFAGPDEQWAALKRVAAAVRADPDALAREARRFGCPEACEDGCCTLAEFVDVYRPKENVPLVVDYTLQVDDKNREVRQYASGGGASRTIKEHLRRAFCRLVIARCHAVGLEINLRVG